MLPEQDEQRNRDHEARERAEGRTHHAHLQEMTEYRNG